MSFKRAMIGGLIAGGTVLLAATLLFDLMAMLLLGLVMLPYDPIRAQWMRVFVMSPIGLLGGGAAAFFGLWLNGKATA